jgi:hypothetical protein
VIVAASRADAALVTDSGAVSSGSVTVGVSAERSAMRAAPTSMVVASKVPVVVPVGVADELAVRWHLPEQTVFP